MPPHGTLMHQQKQQWTSLQFTSRANAGSRQSPDYKHSTGSINGSMKLSRRPYSNWADSKCQRHLLLQEAVSTALSSDLSAARQLPPLQLSASIPTAKRTPTVQEGKRAQAGTRLPKNLMPLTPTRKHSDGCGLCWLQQT